VDRCPNGCGRIHWHGAGGDTARSEGVDPRAFLTSKATYCGRGYYTLVDGDPKLSAAAVRASNRSVT